jgi:hypothetical protein
MPIRFAAYSALAACCLACTAAQAAAPSHGRARAAVRADAQVPAYAPAYAPVKERICGDCPMPNPGFQLPRHAVVVGSWGFLDGGTDFQVLDLDTGTVVHAFVPSPAVPSRRKPRGKRSAVTLPRSALPELVGLANRIWAEQQPIRSRHVSDTAWNLWLIDDKDIRHEAGSGLPDGLAAEWVHRMNKLLGVDDSNREDNPQGK